MSKGCCCKKKPEPVVTDEGLLSFSKVQEWVFALTPLLLGYFELCCVLLDIIPSPFWPIVIFLNLAVIIYFGYPYFEKSHQALAWLLPAMIILFMILSAPIVFSFTVTLPNGLWWAALLAADLIFILTMVWQSSLEINMESLVSFTVLMAWFFSSIQILFPIFTTAFGAQLYFQDSLIILGLSGLSGLFKNELIGSHCPDFDPGSITDSVAKMFSPWVARFMVTASTLTVVAWYAFANPATAAIYALQGFMGVLMAVCPCVLVVISPICNYLANQKILEKGISLKQEIYLITDLSGYDAWLQNAIKATQQFINEQLMLATAYNLMAVPLMAGAFWFFIMPQPYVGAILMNAFSIGLIWRSFQLNEILDDVITSTESRTFKTEADAAINPKQINQISENFKKTAWCGP